MSSEAVSSIDPSLTLSVVDVDDDGNKHAYRLVKIGKDVLLYGADDGHLIRAHDQQLIRRWEDDAVRAVAVSPNQRIVAVGFDSGEVQIYEFDDYQPSKDDDDDDEIHPFCAAPTDKDDGNDLFMSQSDKLMSPWSTDAMRQGPQADTTVRDLLFLNDDLLAVATESGLTVVNLTDCLNETTFLTEESKTEHNGSGIRGLCWNQTDEILTTLAMDGATCYWKCPLSEPKNWKLWRKEEDFNVLKKDVGEVLGSDPWDRSTRPWQNGRLVATPGSNFWQLAEFTRSPELERTEVFQTDTVHKKPMVVIRSKNKRWVTTDRAGEIVLWHLVGSFFVLSRVAPYGTLAHSFFAWAGIQQDD